jgi:predicted GIY-YIG superfamily endonuclease
MATKESLALPVELLGSVERYAVYRCYSDSGQLLYVGETGDLGKRLADHATKLWFVQVRGITLEWYADELEALKAERRAIHVEHPKYNKQHRELVTLSTPSRIPRNDGTGKAGRNRAVATLRRNPGLSDAAAAKKAQVSVRTVQRARREIREAGV